MHVLEVRVVIYCHGGQSGSRTIAKNVFYFHNEMLKMLQGYK